MNGRASNWDARPFKIFGGNVFINGPIPVRPTQAADRIELRPQQHITAGVVQVTPTQAILSVNGYPFVARLTNQEQAAYLADQRTAQFLVTRLDNQQVVIKLIRPDITNPQIVSPVEQDLAARLVTELDFPGGDQQLWVVRALLNARVAVSISVVKEIEDVLNQMGNWNAVDANLAASIKAAGLPLSLLSMRLIGQANHPISINLAAFIEKINQIQTQTNLPADFRFFLESVGQLLNDVIIDPSRPMDEIARAVSIQIGLLGKSLENTLLDQSSQNSPFWPKEGLMIFARFYQIADRLGLNELAQTARQVLEDIHLSQLMNIAKPVEPALETWLSFPLALSMPGNLSGMGDLEARLKIARYPDPAGKDAINLQNTRLVFQFDFPEGRGLQMQLTMHAKRVNTDISVSDETLAVLAASELDGLKKGIENLGYQVSTGSVVVSDEPMVEDVVRSNHPDYNFQSVLVEI